MHVTPPGLEGNGKLSQALEMVPLVIILQQLHGNSEGEIEREYPEVSIVHHNHPGTLSTHISSDNPPLSKRGEKDPNRY